MGTGITGGGIGGIGFGLDPFSLPGPMTNLPTLDFGPSTPGNVQYYDPYGPNSNPSLGGLTAIGGAGAAGTGVGQGGGAAEGGIGGLFGAASGNVSGYSEYGNFLNFVMGALQSFGSNGGPGGPGFGGPYLGGPHTLLGWLFTGYQFGVLDAGPQPYMAAPSQLFGSFHIGAYLGLLGAGHLSAGGSFFPNAPNTGVSFWTTGPFAGRPVNQVPQNVRRGAFPNAGYGVYESFTGGSAGPPPLQTDRGATYPEQFGFPATGPGAGRFPALPQGLAAGDYGIAPPQGTESGPFVPHRPGMSGDYNYGDPFSEFSPFNPNVGDF